MARVARAKPKPKPAKRKVRAGGYANPNLLVETGWLARNLGNPKIKIVDCNVVMAIQPDGRYDIKKGIDDWKAAHIPGAVFIDLLEELAAPHPKLRFMMTPAEQFERVVSSKGISNQHRVILYSRGANYWATRLFLMFRAMGHDNVQVLNGGWDKWMAERRPVESATFTAQVRPGQIINKDDVAAALGRADTCIINALHPDVHSGKKFSPAYGRPGRIPGSVNVYAMDLIDPNTKAFLPAEKLRQKFAATGALKKDRVITYCGGGISATTDSFALLLLGHKNVALYDGSMTDWGPDSAMPIETDPSAAAAGP